MRNLTLKKIKQVGEERISQLIFQVQQSMIDFFVFSDWCARKDLLALISEGWELRKNWAQLVNEWLGLVEEREDFALKKSTLKKSDWSLASNAAESKVWDSSQSF
jgi:hypothetical protein